MHVFFYHFFSTPWNELFELHRKNCDLKFCLDTLRLSQHWHNTDDNTMLHCITCTQQNQCSLNWSRLLLLLLRSRFLLEKQCLSSLKIFTMWTSSVQLLQWIVASFYQCNFWTCFKLEEQRSVKATFDVMIVSEQIESLTDEMNDQHIYIYLMQIRLQSEHRRHT